jgi:hypothetical protein
MQSQIRSRVSDSHTRRVCRLRQPATGGPKTKHLLNTLQIVPSRAQHKAVAFSGRLIENLIRRIRTLARFISLPLMLFGLLCQLSAQLDPNDPNELLRRAIAQVRNRLVRLSNYVCTQTTDRIVLPGRPGCYGGPPPDRFRLSQSDRVRVDVLSTSSGELYSWPGENRFYSPDPFQLVGLLPLSTGGFSGLLRSVFGNDNAFLYAGEVTENGRKLRQFSFRVPRESSQYWCGTRSHDWRTVAFRGTFLLDPETADLVRLVVNVSESPEATGACQATTTLSYGRTPVNELQSLLPASALFELFTTLGLEVRNSSAYSGCHEFEAQSTVRFEAPDAGLRPVEKAPERPALARRRSFPDCLYPGHQIPHGCCGRYHRCQAGDSHSGPVRARSSPG